MGTPFSPDFEKTRQHLLAQMERRVQELQRDMQAIRTGRSVGGRWAHEFITTHALLVRYIIERRNLRAKARL